MIIIGNREVLFSGTFLCPAQEFISLRVAIPQEIDPWKIEIRFVENTIQGDNQKKENIGPL